MSASSSTSVSNSNSSKRTHDDMEAENKEEENDENKDDNDEEDDNISGLQDGVDMHDDDDAVDVDASDDEGNDSNNVLYNMDRKGLQWTAEEDAIILHERENKKGIRGYTTRVANLLKGRTVEAINARWKRYVRKNYATDPPFQANAKWTAEEDAIILREIKNQVKGYPARSAKCLNGRSVQAVIHRWHCHLKKHHAADAPVRNNVRWTAEEDAIILRERENEIKCYSTRVANHLKGRSVEAIKTRWNQYLKIHHAVETQASTAAP